MIYKITIENSKGQSVTNKAEIDVENDDAIVIGNWIFERIKNLDSEEVI